MDRDEDYAAYVAARWAGLVRAAVLLGCSRTDAEDLVQTALVRCYRVWWRVQRANDPDAYVYRVLLNCLASSRRRRWWGEHPSDDIPAAAVSDHAEVAAVRAAVMAALAGLGEDQRRVVVLRYWADLTERQVADVLGVAVGTVKSRTSRALAALSLELGDETPSRRI